MEHALVELNYYWGDDSHHTTEHGLIYTGNIQAMVQEHKPSKASVAYAIAYLNGKYYATLEVL